MNEFEKTLARLKAESIRREQLDELARRKEAAEKEAFARIASERAEAELRAKYLPLIESLIPVVNGVLEGLGNQTWGKRNYTEYMHAVAGVKTESLKITPPYEIYKPGNVIRNETVLGVWGVAKIERDPIYKVEFFQVSLVGLLDECYYFRVPQRPTGQDRTVTATTDLQELEDLMIHEFLLGPLLYTHSVRDYTPRGG